MTTPASTCRACGAAVTGKFCNQCGTAAGPGGCGACGAPLTPGARFCHRCGSPAVAASGRQERTAWFIAGAAVVLAVAVVAYLAGRGTGPQVPAMANAGNASGRSSAPPPDISSMSPRERFDRLFDRVLRAAEAQSADTVTMFAPMALSAYGQLDQVDQDARYHAAMIHLVVGEMAQSKAKADTILAENPKHLFGFIIRGEVAEQENDTAALKKAYADFLAAFDAETKAARQEYREHQPVLDDFRNRALANAQ